MILRALTLVAGLAGAAATSQFPEYSQQYLQRLGGAVDALAEVIADFDTSAARAGLTRDAALNELQGTAFLEARRRDMTATINRHSRLQADLATLQGQGPFMRAYHLPRFTDPQIAKAAWGAYQPALPLTPAGVLFAVVGFIGGALVLRLFLALVIWPLGRRAAKPA